MDKRMKKRIEDQWDAEHEKQLERVLSHNEELRKLFQDNPEKKEEYKAKILDLEGVHYPKPPEDICCKTCIFQLPPASIGGKMTSRHDWGECRVMKSKPHDVMYEGAKCEFYERQK